MADLIRQMEEGHETADIDGVINEVAEARGTYDSLDDRLDAMGDAPSPSSSTPAMDGTGAAGSSDDYARADHVHPTDTSRQAALTTAQLDAVNSGITSAGVAQIETNKTNILTVADSGGAKNILDYTISSGSIDGLSWTVNADKSITVEVTGTHAKKDIVLKTFANGVGDNMFLSGCPSGGNISTGFALYAANGNTAAVIAADTGNGVELSYNSIMFVSIIINANVPNGTYTFKPMICAKTMWDVSHTYQPYAMSNVELTEQTNDNANDIGLRSFKKVFSRLSSSSTTYTYTMAINDFGTNIGAGTYIISIVPWSTTATHSLYMVSVTGANPDKYHCINKIAGDDASISLTENSADITITSSGRVLIFALS